MGDLPNGRCPDPRVEELARRFKSRISNAAIERIATGFRWASGPVYFRDGCYPVGRHFRANSNYANGNIRDREVRLLVCEHDSRRVTRSEPDGAIIGRSPPRPRGRTLGSASARGRNSYASSSNGSNFGWNQICAMRVGTTALPITAVSRMVY